MRSKKKSQRSVARVEQLEKRQLLSAGLTDGVYHGNAAYTTAPQNNPNATLTDNTLGGTNSAISSAVAYAASHTVNYSFVNTNDRFVYAGGSEVVVKNFLNNDAAPSMKSPGDAAGTALTDTADVDDTIFDAEGYFQTPVANDTGSYTVTLGGDNDDDLVAVYMGGNGTPGSGTLVASAGYAGANAGLASFTLTNVAAGTNSSAVASIPIEILYANGYGGAQLTILSGSNPATGVLIRDPHGTQITSFVTAPTNEPLPGAPTLTDVTGNSSVLLNWSSTFLATSYSVYRYLSSASPSTATAVKTGLTALTYTDTTVTNGQSYKYYVTANDSSGSASSNTVTAAPAAAPTGPVTLLNGSRTSSTTVQLSFTAPVLGTNYVITRSSAPGGTQTTLTTSGGQTATTFTDTTASSTGNTGYYYTVTSVNSSGSSTPVVLFVGDGEGWAADYYSSDVADPQGTGIYKPLTGDASGSILGFERIDSTIAVPPANTPSNWNSIQTNVDNDFAVRWVGYVEAPVTGYYSFGVNAADDKEQVTVYDPNDLTNGNPTPVNISPSGHVMTGYGDTYTVPVVATTGSGYAFTAGQKYLVQIDYNQGYGGLNANLYWSASSTAGNQTAGTYDVMSTQLVPTDDITAPTPSFSTVDASGSVAKDASYYALSTAVHAGVVALQWNPIAADSYNIYRSTTQSGGYALLNSIAAPTNATPLTYTDTSVTNGVTYYYIITGVNLSGETPVNLTTGVTSGLTASATPMAVAPAVPTGIAVGGTNSTTQGIQIHVVFPAVAYATSYIIQRAPESPAGSGIAGTFATVPGGGDVTGSGTISFIDTDASLKANLNYFYQVISSDGLLSAPSAAVESPAVGAPLASEGTIEVDVDAASYSNGSTSSIVNFGNQGGTFAAVGGAITVGSVTDDSTSTYQAFEFNGTDSASSSFNAPADVSGNSSRSIEVWVDNPTIDTIEETMVSYGHRGASSGNNEGFSDGSIYGVGQWGGPGYDVEWSSTAPGVVGTGAPSADAWHYLVFTYNGSMNDVYVDGNLYLQEAVGSGGLATVAGFPVNLAAQNTATSSGFTAALNGSLDLASVRIETGALTSADVATNYAAGIPDQSPPEPTGLAPLWSGSAVSLTWVAQPGATSYSLYRATTPGGEGATPIATGITANSYIDSTVTAGGTYYYQITAVDSVGLQSQRSFEAQARTSLPATVIISELQAINDNTLADAAGDYPDWVELYNPTQTTVNLNGYYLTDSKSDATLWQIPAVSLGSGDYLIIFCDGTNQTNPASELHSDFSLGGSGGYVALVNPAGTAILWSYNYPQQYAADSYGIATAETASGGSVITSYGATGFLTPTPGGPDGEIIGSALTAEPVFNQSGGVYAIAATFQVGITDSTTGASIYYTTDGTLPSASNGTLYTGPITVNSETSLRAVAIAPDDLPSFPAVVNFIYTAQVIDQDADGNPPAGWPATWGNSVAHYGMNPAVVDSPLYSAEIQQDLLDLPSFSITIPLGDLFDSTTGIYSNPAEYGSAWTRLASVQYIPNNGTAGFTANVGLAIKGDASTESPDAKHGFRMEFSDEYGLSQLTYPMFSTGTDNFSELDLRTDENNSWQYQDPQDYVGVRDEFSDSTLAALGVPAQRYQVCYLYINGVFWGLYDAIDRDDNSWAANTFGGSASGYDTIKSGGVHNGFLDEADDGTMTAWDQLVSDMSTMDFSSNANYEMIQGNNPDGTPNPAYANLLNVADLAQYMMMIYYTGNLDAPYSSLVNDPNNFYADRPVNGSTGFIFTATDSEFTLLSVDTDQVNAAPTTASDYTATPAWFFQQLETNSSFKQLVADDIQKDFYNNGPLTTNATLTRFESLTATVYGPVVEESARWGDTLSLPPYADGTLANGYTYTRDTDWNLVDSAIQNNYLPQRTAIVLGQLAAVGLVPSLTAPTYSQYGGTIAAGYQLTMTNPNSSGSIYYTLDGTDPFTVSGTLSPSAMLYSGEVTLDQTTEVKAAVLSSGSWSGEDDFTFFAPITTVQVTELDYDPRLPAGSSYSADDYEFIELKNFGTQSVNLDGAMFTNGITYTFGSEILSPGQVGVVVSNLAAFDSLYGTAVDVLGSYDSSGTHFSNSGEEVTLVDSLGSTMVDFTYSPSWYPSTAGQGPSLEVIDPAVNPNLNLAANWDASPESGGTPGVDDSIPTGAPTGLTVSFTNQQVVLSWSAVAGAATYNIYRGTSSGGESATPIATGITNNSFTDVTAVGGQTYYYTVAAVDPGGTSPVSNEASIVVPQTPVSPAIVTEPVSEVVKAGGTVTFTAVATGYPVPVVQWYASNNSGGTWTAISGANSSTYSFPLASTAPDGLEYEAIFTNSQGTITTTPVTLTAIAPTLTAWNYDTSDKTGAALSTKGTNTSPDPSTGTGTDTSIGMALVSGPDASGISADPGSSDGNAATQQVWKIVGTNGWSSTAGIGTQGAQFLVSTVGFNSVSIQFDWSVTAQGEGNLAVEYTTNGGGSWLLAPDLNANGDPGVSVKTNSTSANTVLGEYFSAYNSAGTVGWYNRLTVDLNGVAGVANDANFGIRLINASTGGDCVNLSGQPLDNSSGNWRLDEVDINASLLPAAPIITTQPTSKVATVGSSATFTAADTGNPTPTIQWNISNNSGATWTPISGATSSTLTVLATGIAMDGTEYQAVFTNSLGSMTSNPVTLNVVAAPVTAWNFDSSDKTGTAIAVGVNTSPDPSTGSGSASSIGMALVSGPDASAILVDPGSSDGNAATQQAWKIVGTNGWSSTAPIGSQGAQFMVSTAGFNSVSLQFDLDVIAQGEGNLAVEYTLNGGTTWLLAPSLNSNGDSGISVKTNSTSSNTVQGEYFNAYNSAGTEVFYNRLTADFAGIAGAANNPNFGVRLVNASTGADCVNLSGQPLNNTSGNWRIDEVDINGTSTSNVTWTGAADGVNWNVPGNWSDDLLPTAATIVSIGTGFGTIEMPAGAYAVKTISTASAIEVDAGASFVLHGSSTFSGGPDNRQHRCCNGCHRTGADDHEWIDAPIRRNAGSDQQSARR